MMIEFLGIPGSGKSTVAAMLGSVLRKKGIYVWLHQEQPRFSLSLICGFILHPFVAINWLMHKDSDGFLQSWESMCVKGEGAEVHAKISRWMRRDLWMVDVALKMKQADAAIFDEGIVLHMLSYMRDVFVERGLLKQSLEEYRKVAPDVKIVIRQTGVDECIRRLRERGRLPKRMKGLSDDQILQVMKKYNEQINVLEGLLEEVGFDVICLSGQDAEADVDIILSEFELRKANEGS